MKNLKELDRFEKNLFSFIEKWELISDSDTVLVAVSGGVDSVVLLHSLKRISEIIRFNLICAHLNHGIRKESDEEMKFVVDLASSLGLKIVAEERNVLDYRRRMKLSLEEAARDVRMNFLTETAKRVGANKIALAHNKNDRVENFFIRLFRGSGIRGIASMKVKEGMIIRPLLNMSRRDIEDYAKRQNLRYVVDKSNYDLRFTRNRIRHLLLPFIREKICQNVDEKVWRFLTISDELWDFISSIVREKYERIVSEGKDYIIISDTIRNEHPFIMSEILRIAYEKLKGDIKNLNFEKLDKVKSLIKNGKNFEYNLGSSIFISSSFGKIKLFKRTDNLTDMEFEYKINGEGIIEINTLKILITFSIMDTVPSDLGDGIKKAVFDLKKVRFPLSVRNKRAGDRIKPIGMKGHKKVKKIMIEKKIDRNMRSSIPILTDATGRIMWIIGYTISEEFKVDSDTEKVLIVEVFKR